MTVKQIDSTIRTLELLKKHNNITNDEIKAISLSILALEKAKPKQPIIAKVGIKTVWFCPSCGAKIKSSYNYCNNCGSRVLYDKELSTD